MLLIEGATLDRGKSKGLLTGCTKAMELTVDQSVALEQTELTVARTGVRVVVAEAATSDKKEPAVEIQRGEK